MSNSITLHALWVELNHVKHFVNSPDDPWAEVVSWLETNYPNTIQHRDQMYLNDLLVARTVRFDDANGVLHFKMVFGDQFTISKR